MNRIVKSALAAALATAGVAALPSLASAETICVNAGCQTNNLATVQSALNAAQAIPGPDVIKVGGTEQPYFGPFSYTATGTNNDVTIEGVPGARARPVFQRGDDTPILGITGSGASLVRNVSIDDNGGPGTTSIDLFRAKAVDLDVHGTKGATAVSLTNANLEGAEIFMGLGRGVLARGDKSTVTSSAIAGDVAVEESFGELVVERSHLQGRSAGLLGTGDRGVGRTGVDVRSSVISASNALAFGVSLTDVELAKLSRSTVAGLNSAPASGSTALSQASIAKTTTTVLTGVVLDGFGRRLKRSAGGSHRAHINAARSEWDATGDSLGDFGVFTESGDVHTDPKLVNPAGFDFRLRGTDKAVDLLGDASTDVFGRGAVDGNGDGKLATDAGALEYQRTAPVLTPVSLPTTGTAGQAVAFSVKAKDADGDAISVKWSFGDGTTGTGASTSHVFATKGTFNVLATVKDAVGLTDTRGVSITIK